MVVFLVAGGVTAVTLMVGLVTNAASEQQSWPGWLHAVQQHPWLSLAVSGAVAVVLTALLATLSDAGSPAPTQPGPPGTEPPAPGSALVMRSLPRDAATFTNRVAELRRLVDSVEAARASGRVLPVHAIDGMAGVGKTTFAVHAGHLLAERFPDGQLFVNLNGHTPGRRPVGTADALASLLTASGVPSPEIPSGTDPEAVTAARAALWRSRLADKKMLLILDNAAGYSQIEPLLPGGDGCLVLVTSRRRLAVQEEVITQMEALSPDDAVALFTRLCGREPGIPDQATPENLVRLCGYLPLAVSLLASRLRHHPVWTAADLEARVLAAQDRLGEMRAGDRAVAAAFDLSYQDLPADRQRFFRRLGFFPGADVDAHIAAVLDSIPMADARRQLEALYDDHLIDENAGGRYRLHDLVRDYAGSLAAEEDSMDRIHTTELACDYYLTAIADANRRIARSGAAIVSEPGPLPASAVPVLDTRAAALSWLEEERANVLACIEQANTSGQYSTVVKLARAMAPFLRHAGPWDQAAQLHRTAAEAARRVGDRQARAEALADLGVVRRLMAAYPSAVDALTEALATYRETGDRAGQAHALNQLGIVWYLTAANQSAEEAQTEALDIYRAFADRLGEANALADLGMVRRQTGRYRAAADVQAEALAIYRDLGDLYGQANALRDLGIVHCITGDYGQATARHSEALGLYQQLGDRLHQAYALNEIGLVRRLTGDLAGSREAHSEALEHYTELGDRFGRANSTRSLGVLNRLAGQHDEAIRGLSEALAAYRELGSRGGEAAALNELGAARHAAGDLAGAVVAFDQALAIFRDLGDRCGEAEALNNWGMLLISSDPPAAQERFRSALQLAKEIECPLEEARALEGLGRCGTALGTAEEAATSLQEAAAVYQRLGAAEAVGEVTRLLADQGTPNRP
jgi:tetratricopeptide (TPR) repeat protein